MQYNLVKQQFKQVPFNKSGVDENVKCKIIVR